MKKLFLRVLELILVLFLFSSRALSGALVGQIKYGEERLVAFFLSIIVFCVLITVYYFLGKPSDYIFPQFFTNLFAKIDTAKGCYARLFSIIHAALITVLVFLVFSFISAFIYYGFISNDESNDSSHNLIINSYTLVFPKSIAVQQVSDNNYSLSLNTENVGFIKCPMPETGFEAWDFEMRSRMFERDGEAYGVDLWIGQSKSDAVEDLSLIFMHKGEFDDWYKDGNHVDSCYVQLEKSLNLKDLEAIYKSIDVI